LLRRGISDGDLKECIVEALRFKPARHEFGDRPGQIVRLMSMTGG
jgi:cyclic pyranopterin phosphate synthase